MGRNSLLQPANKQIEHGRMERVVKLQARLMGAHPANGCFDGLQAFQFHPDMLVDIGSVDKLDFAAFR
jgi:hypothetical protein